MKPRTRALALAALAGMVLLAAAGVLLGNYRVREGPFLFSAGSVLLITFALIVARLLRTERPARDARPLGEPATAGEPVEEADEDDDEGAADRLGPVKAPLVVPQDDGSGPYHACMRCGSLDLKRLMLSGGLFPDSWRCERCGYKGPRIEIDRLTDYQAFLEGLRADHEARSRDRRLSGP